jgi:hypothetical protein
VVRYREHEKFFVHSVILVANYSVTSAADRLKACTLQNPDDTPRVFDDPICLKTRSNVFLSARLRIEID